MVKKLIAGVLGLTVLGAAGSALVYQTTRQANAAAEAPVAEVAQAPVAAQDAGAAQQQAPVDGSVQQAAPNPDVGQPWTASGTITAVDDFGFTLAVGSREIYVELGPPAFWQAQGVALNAGEAVTVAGFENGELHHAATVTLASGQQITVRSELGQPLWSGGAQNRNGATNGSASANGLQDGQQVPQPQARVEEWITLTGTITAINRSQITLRTAGGEVISFQAGRPSFFEAQGVTLAIGDEIEVLGFYQGPTFSAGDITKLATGERVMLRDPNGRPLWAGPGQSQGGQGAGAQGGRGAGAQGGQGAGGAGRGYRGGQ